MHGSRRMRSSRWSLLLSALISICLFSGAVLAGDDIPVYVDEYGFTLRGEPGEDPHLRVRVKENIQINEDCSTVAFSPGADGPSLLDPYRDGISCWESRLLAGWLILSRIVIDTLPR